MSSEAAEPHPDRERGHHRGPRRGGHADLFAVGRGADACRRVHGKADVSGIRERRATAVDADADTHLDAVAPRIAPELALDCDGGLEGGGRLLEDGEELVGTRVDLAPARSPHRPAE